MAGAPGTGERFYGLGNGYFAFALASVMLVAAFAPLSAVATAAVLVGLGIVDGLPRLGADVGGSLTLHADRGRGPGRARPGRPRAAGSSSWPGWPWPPPSPWLSAPVSAAR